MKKLITHDWREGRQVITIRPIWLKANNRITRHPNFCASLFLCAHTCITNFERLHLVCNRLLTFVPFYGIYPVFWISSSHDLVNLGYFWLACSLFLRALGILFIVEFLDQNFSLIAFIIFLVPSFFWLLNFVFCFWHWQSYNFHFSSPSISKHFLYKWNFFCKYFL